MVVDEVGEATSSDSIEDKDAPCAAAALLLVDSVSLSTLRRLLRVARVSTSLCLARGYAQLCSSRDLADG